MGMGLSSDELTTENFLPKPLSSKCVWVTPKIPPTEGKTPHFFRFYAESRAMSTIFAILN